MKKYLVAGAMVLNMFGAQLAFADIIPSGQKAIPVCAQIEFGNLFGSANPFEFVIYARESGPMYQNPAPFKKSYVVHDSDCVSPTGGKYGKLELYAVDSSYAQTLPTNGTYDPASDVKAYKENIQLDMNVIYVDQNSTLQYQHNQYIVGGVDNLKKQLYLAPYGSVTNLAATIPDLFPGTQLLPGSGLDFQMTQDTLVKPTPSRPNVFTDVPSTSPYYDALVYLKGKGVVSGYPDGSFQPSVEVKRVEFLGAIGRAIYPETQDCAATTSSFKFPDVDKGAWYADLVCMAYGNKIVAGYTDGTFRPLSNINFAEASAMLVRAFQIPVAPQRAGEFWYQNYVDMLQSLNVVPSTVTTINQRITRGEMAEFLYKIMLKNGNYTLLLI